MNIVDRLVAPTICILFVLTCLSTLSGCQDDNSFENISTTATEAQTSADEANGVEGSENSNSVVFYSDEGVILGKDDVPQGGFPAPPVQGLSKEGYIFTGWTVKPDSDNNDATVAAEKTTDGIQKENDPTLPQIDEDIDFEAIYIDIRDKSNVFALPAVYGKKGDTFETKLQLCGKVVLCAFDIQISYDPAILELTSIKSDLDLDVVASHDEANHTIKFNYATAKNRTRTAEVIELYFKIKSADKAKTLIQLDAVEIVAVDANNENLLISAPFTLIDGMVYIK